MGWLGILVTAALVLIALWKFARLERTALQLAAAALLAGEGRATALLFRRGL